MNYDSPQPEGPGLVKGLALGDYAEPKSILSRGSMLSQGVMIAGMINPAVGTGLFFPPAMAAHMFPKLASKLEHPLVAPFVMGHFNLGSGGMAGRAEDYAAKNGLKNVAKFAPKGAWSNKYFSWLADEGVIEGNRKVIGMVRHAVSEGGGWLSRGGVEAGLRASGLKAGEKLLSKAGVGAMARFGAVGFTRALPLVGWGVFAYDLYQAGRGLYNAMDTLAQTRHEASRSEVAVPMVDNMQAQTERRRALASIQQSRMNARSAFGYEARRFHL